jgi:hypothetical protein
MNQATPNQKAKIASAIADAEYPFGQARCLAGRQEHHARSISMAISRLRRCRHRT